MLVNDRAGTLLTLTGSSTYGGGTIVTAGILEIASVLPTGHGVTIGDS